MNLTLVPKEISVSYLILPNGMINILSANKAVMISHFTAMFHYRNGRINTTPLPSAATTHFFIISFIFHFCKAASAPGREDPNIQKSAVLLFCREAKDRSPGRGRQRSTWPRRQGNQGTRQRGAVSPSASLEQLHQHPMEHRMAAEEGQPLQRGPARDV